jgi:hypothetical protein
MPRQHGRLAARYDERVAFRKIARGANLARPDAERFKNAYMLRKPALQRKNPNCMHHLPSPRNPVFIPGAIIIALFPLRYHHGVSGTEGSGNSK